MPGWLVRDRLTRYGPIFINQIRYSLVFPTIVCNKGHLPGYCLCGYLKIIGADALPLSFQFRTNLSIGDGIGIRK